MFISRIYLSRIMSRCCSHQMLIKSLSRMSESVEYYNSAECLIQYLVISHFALFKFCRYGRSGIISLKLVEEESNEERDLHGSPFLPLPQIFIQSMAHLFQFHQTASSAAGGSIGGLFAIHKERIECVHQRPDFIMPSQDGEIS